MTPEKQRVAIAEVCGWSDIHPRTRKGNRDPNGVRNYGYHPMMCEWDTMGKAYTQIPNYLNDLNAMAEAEKVLKNDELAYQDHLAAIVESGDASTYWWEACHYRHRLITATAAQRAEAFLRTINKRNYSLHKGLNNN